MWSPFDETSIWPQRHLNRFWNPDKTEMRCTHPTSDISSIFCRSEKKCIFDHFCVCFTSIFAFYVYTWRVLSVFHQYWSYSWSNKDNFHMTFDLENFTVIFIWSKNSKFGVTFIMIHAVQSLSNQNDSSWKLILLDNENKMKILSYQKYWID